MDPLLCRAKDAFPTIQGVETLYDSLERAVKANPNAPSLGRRPIDSEGNAGDYEWITYKELQGMQVPAMDMPCAASVQKTGG